tara:strand:+ start:93 stop:317 length:225 start_codon:yes stop_codon:yes gene_type:complete
MTKTSKLPKGETKIPDKNTPEPLLEGPPRVINIGLSSFADDLKKQDVEMVNLNWSPPARGNVELANLLAKLFYK